MIWEEKKIKHILTGLCFLGGQTVISPQFSKVLEKKAKDPSVLTWTFGTESHPPSVPLTHAQAFFPAHWGGGHRSPWGQCPASYLIPRPDSDTRNCYSLRGWLIQVKGAIPLSLMATLAFLGHKSGKRWRWRNEGCLCSLACISPYRSGYAAVTNIPNVGTSNPQKFISSAPWPRWVSWELGATGLFLLGPKLMKHYPVIGKTDDWFGSGRKRG